MKKLSIITGILICAMLLLAALGAVCGTVNSLSTDTDFYCSMSRQAVMDTLGVTDAADASDQVTAYIGLTEAEQHAFAEEIVPFMRGETDVQPDILNEKEQQHMLDVRAITQGMANMSKTYLTLAVILAVVAAWTGAKLEKRVMPKLVGSLTAVSVVMLIVVNLINQVSAGGFETLFVQMHESLFANDLWMMDPATDILIRMMPQPLFEQALLNGANQALRMFIIVWIMLMAVQITIERMIRRQLKKDSN